MRRWAEAPGVAEVAEPDAPVRDSESRLLAAVGELADAVRGESVGLDGLLHLIAAKACDLSGMRRCSMHLPDGPPGRFRGRIVHAELDFEVLDERVRRLTPGLAGDGLTDDLLSTRRPVFIRCTRTDPRVMPAVMRRWGVRSVLGVPLLDGGRVVGLLFLDNEDDPRACTPLQEVAVVRFAEHAVRAITVAQQLDALRRAVMTERTRAQTLESGATLQRRLARMSADGADGAQLIAALADAVSKPCALYGGNLLRLASASGGSSAGRMPASLESCGATQEAASAAGRGEPFAVDPAPRSGRSHRLLVAPVDVRSERVGYVVIKEFATRLGELDALAIAHAAMSLAVRFAKEDPHDARRHAAAEALLGQLICGHPDGEGLGRRAHALGVDLATRHAVVLLSAVGAQDAGRDAVRDLAQALDLSASRRALATRLADGIVVLMPLSADGSEREAIEHAKQRVVQASRSLRAPEAGGLRAALSGACQAPDAVAGALADAQNLARLVSALGSCATTTVHAVGDLGACRVFLLASDPALIARYARDALGPLLQEKPARRSELLRTLEAFVGGSRSVRRCAEALHVHDNTVRYRLTRIEKLTGLAVQSEADDQLTAQIGIVALRLQGALSAG